MQQVKGCSVLGLEWKHALLFKYSMRSESLEA